MKKYLLLSTIFFAWVFAGCKKGEVDNAPAANFLINNVNAEVKEGASLKVINTSAFSGKSLSYYWDFGNGNTSTEKEPTAAYGMHGQYNVKLTVTDEKGRASTVTKEVTVLCVFASANHPPLF